MNNILLLIEELDKILTNNGLKYSLAYGSVLGAVREKGVIEWDNEIDIVVPYHNYDEMIRILKRELPTRFQVSTNTNDDYELFFARVNYKNMSHHQLHVDVFPLIGVPNNKILRFLFIYKCHILNKIYYIKKLNYNEIYRDNKKRKFQAKILKKILMPISTTSLLNKLKKLAAKYDYETSDFIYTLGGSYKFREVFQKSIYNNLIRTEFNGMKLPIPLNYDDYLTKIYGNDYMIPKKKNYLS